MNPAVIFAVSGSLAFIAILFVLLRLRELRRIHSVAEQLEAFDRQFSDQLSKIEKVIAGLDDDQADPERSGEATEGSWDLHQSGWGEGHTAAYLHLVAGSGGGRTAAYLRLV